jgi:hypothetical protein
MDFKFNHLVLRASSSGGAARRESRMARRTIGAPHSCVVIFTIGRRAGSTWLD